MITVIKMAKWCTTKQGNYQHIEQVVGWKEVRFIFTLEVVAIPFSIILNKLLNYSGSIIMIMVISRETTGTQLYPYDGSIMAISREAHSYTSMTVMPKTKWSVIPSMILFSVTLPNVVTPTNITKNCNTAHHFKNKKKTITINTFFFVTLKFIYFFIWGRRELSSCFIQNYNRK